MVTSPAIGFIGLGNMGEPMAGNLVRAGHAVIVLDARDEPMARLEALGARRGATPADIARAAGIVITMLPSPQVVEAVVLGPQGLIEGLAPGAVHIDMSTTGPGPVRRIAAALGARGIAMLDAPVSRGQQGAIDGTLSIMAGGDRAVFERCEPVLRVLGSDIFYCGGTGMGAATKLVNNLIQGTISAVVAEGLVLGAKAGIDVPRLIEVLSASSADNYVLRHFFPNKALRGDFAPGGTVDIVRKDLALALGLGDELGVPLLLAALGHQLYGVLHARGRGDLDFTAIITPIEEAAGIEVRLPPA